MTATQCEKCAQSISMELAVYSSAGELLCSPCSASANIVELESRGADVRRRGRIVVGVAIALLLLVSSLMFAAGLGKAMAEALIALGILIALGPIADRLWVILFLNLVFSRRRRFMSARELEARERANASIVDGFLFPPLISLYLLLGGVAVALVGAGIRWLLS